MIDYVMIMMCVGMAEALTYTDNEHRKGIEQCKAFKNMFVSIVWKSIFVLHYEFEELVITARFLLVHL